MTFPRRRSRAPRSLFVAAREDPALFGDLFVEYRDQMLAFFGRQVFDPEVAFDLMAETFARGFDGIEDFRGASDAEGRAWLWTIARHILFRWRERGTIERRGLEAIGLADLAITDAEFEHVEELADLDRMRVEIADALHSLSQEQREAVQLRVIDELDYPVIAQRLGVSAQVVRARVSRGLRELGRQLRPGDEPAHDPVSS